MKVRSSFAKHEFCKPLQSLIASHRAAASMGEYIGDRKGVKIGEEESWLDALPPYVHALLPPASIGTGSAFFEGESTTCWARCPAEESRPDRFTNTVWNLQRYLFQVPWYRDIKIRKEKRFWNLKSRFLFYWNGKILLQLLLKSSIKNICHFIPWRMS